MNGGIAQMIALTCYGNAFLRGRTIPVFFPANSACACCERIWFVERPKSLLAEPQGVRVAENPDAWFEYLKGLQVRGLRLSSRAENDPRLLVRLSRGFLGGGSHWLLEAVLPHGRSRFWQERSELGDRQASNRRIWRVTYEQIAERKTLNIGSASLKSLRDELLATLREVHRFAERHRCDGFTESFARAIQSLTDGAGAFPGYQRDLTLEGVLSPEGENLLDACRHAWVFGGMGSWIDQEFVGAEERIHSRLSARLYRALEAAIPAATNSSFRPDRRAL